MKKSKRVRSPTRELILDAAEQLIAVKGVHGFTLKDIAEPLGFRVPAIYKHYTSRHDVLVELSKRYIDKLSRQFSYSAEALRDPRQALRTVVDAFVRFHIAHPAFVRLSLIDFATPQGGMEYIRLAAGGPFRSNFSFGPLAPMHMRLKTLLAKGEASKSFRSVAEPDFYRLIKSVLLIRLVFPDDLLLGKPGAPAQKAIAEMIWETAWQAVSPQSG